MSLISGTECSVGDITWLMSYCYCYCVCVCVDIQCQPLMSAIDVCSHHRSDGHWRDSTPKTEDIVVRQTRVRIPPELNVRSGKACLHIGSHLLILSITKAIYHDHALFVLSNDLFVYIFRYKNISYTQTENVLIEWHLGECE